MESGEDSPDSLRRLVIVGVTKHTQTRLFQRLLTEIPQEGTRVRCMVCGNEFEMIKTSHLKRHQMTLKDYRDRFPDARTITPQALNRLREINRGRKHSAEVRQKISQSHRRAWAMGKYADRAPRDYTPDAETRLRKRRGQRAVFQDHLKISDANGNSFRLLCVKTNGKRPLLVVGEGKVYPDNTVFPPLTQEDLEKLVVKFVIQNRMSLGSVLFHWEGGSKITLKEEVLKDGLMSRSLRSD